MDRVRGVGRAIFAAVLLMIGGVLNIIYGIAAIGNSKFFVHDTHYVFASLKSWGWITLVLGILEILASLSSVSRRHVRAVLRDRRRFTRRDRRAARHPRIPVLVAGGVRVEPVDHLRADAPRGRGPMGASPGLGGADDVAGSPTSSLDGSRVGPAAAGSTVTNRASIRNDEADLGSGNDTSSAELAIKPLPSPAPAAKPGRRRGHGQATQRPGGRRPRRVKPTGSAQKLGCELSVRWTISSRMVRTVSIGWPCGSVRSQSM